MRSVSPPQPPTRHCQPQHTQSPTRHRIVYHESNNGFGDDPVPFPPDRTRTRLDKPVQICPDLNKAERPEQRSAQPALEIRNLTRQNFFLSEHPSFFPGPPREDFFPSRAERILAALTDAHLRHLLAPNPNLHDHLAQWLEALLASPRNLTAVREPELALAKHILEPLSGWNRILNADLPVPHGPLIDIGSGNGAPGLPIALAEPQRRALLLDSRSGAVDFLSKATAAHPRIQTRNDRAESAASGALRERFAVAVSRAAAPPPIALELCLPLLDLGGLLAAWTGSLDDAQQQQLIEIADTLGAIVAPIDTAPDIFVALKSRRTPDTYPRRWTQIRRAPLGSGRN